MKKIILRLSFSLFSLFCLSIIHSQITFGGILNLQNQSEKKNQELFFLNGYSIIDKSNDYLYLAKKKCNPHQVFNDSCKWKCSSQQFKPKRSNTEISFDNVKFENFKGELVSSKNFEVRNYVEYNFAKNYNRSDKTATTFIDVNFCYTMKNTNCKNSFYYEKPKITHSIDIQFSDNYEWQNFKNDILKNAEFKSTFKVSEESLRVEYVIKNGVSKVNDYYLEKGTRIYFYEYDNYSKVEIIFNQIVS